jgi:hypothetical protein
MGRFLAQGRMALAWLRPMRVLTKNLVHRGGRQPHHQLVMDSSYTNFLETHPPTFTEVADPLEADNWFCIIESKFGLFHCTEF